jgi:hypothetical protein
MVEQATILASRLPERHNKLLAAYIYIPIYLQIRHWPGIDPAGVRLLEREPGQGP